MSKARSLADFIEADGSATIDGLTVGQGAGNVATNTAVGASALAANTTGASNTAIGINALDANTTGNSNTAVGESALTSNVTGERNTAMGRESLKNTTSSENTAFGNEALKLNSSGAYNTAVGSFALNVNTTASYNTAVGYQASYSNTTGINNVAVGYLALANSTTANFNVAVGKGAGSNITTGSYNYLVGRDTGGSITTGIFNHGFGVDCLATVTDGGYNVGMGSSALRYTTGSQNTAVGQQAGKEITTGSKNTILGRYTGNQGGLDIRTSSNNIVLSDGDGNPMFLARANYTTAIGDWYTTTGSHRINLKVSQGNTVLVVSGYSGSNADIAQFSAIDQANYNGAATALKIGRNSSTGRSINAGGTVNASGADYAEYMVKAGNFNIAKGDICGIDSEGKLTNVFADSISFVIKSTDPSYVGGDTWFVDRPKNEDNEDITEGEEYDAWVIAQETARQQVDRIAFSGQVPVNVTGATSGQYIVPTDDNGTIKGIAVNETDMTLSQYMKSVGKVIAIEEDGRAKVIVKTA